MERGAITVRSLIKNKKRLFLVLGGLVVVVIILISVFSNKPAATAYVEVKKGDVIQEVDVSGKVKAAESVDLAFERSGRISRVLVSAGDKVSAGQMIASLDMADLYAEYDTAVANLHSREADLAGLKAGSKPEEILVYEARLDSAAISLDSAKRELVNKLDDAYAKSNDVLTNKIKGLFYETSAGDYQLIFSISNDYVLESEIEKSRNEIAKAMLEWKKGDYRSYDYAALSEYAPSAIDTLEDIRGLLDKLTSSLENSNLRFSITQGEVDSWKTDVSASRTVIDTVMATTLAAKDKFVSARSSYLIAEKELSLNKSAASPESIAMKEAAVMAAEGSVKSTRAQIEKGIIRSPITGIVGREDIKLGENASIGVSYASVISNHKFQIEANLPEADVAKIAIGNSAKVTLDPYGDDVVFEASVISIDPSETVINGVTTYKTVLEFASDDARIRSGMTADANVMAAKKEGVLSIPQRSVISEDGRKFVKIITDKAGVFRESDVTTGLRGSDGSVEILSGISEGDKVVTYSSSKSAK